jgi:hypothetical protein
MGRKILRRFIWQVRLPTRKNKSIFATNHGILIKYLCFDGKDWYFGLPVASRGEFEVKIKDKN